MCEDADIDHAVELEHFALENVVRVKGPVLMYTNVYMSKARAIKRIIGDPFKKDIEQGIFICVVVDTQIVS
ncbi:hypothetical protein Pint_14462 [Pistacia integerrima]|uniref:Uncharacterized protein n=1 Tax=Pistacia integerrima TaxID=434235 RepID=A0ACC0Y9A7_9ROSI|nr:hypothetical protein Pint_14462 [Pistacia integerrima]